MTRSLRISSRHFDVTVDQDFEGVMAGCADKKRPAGWIGKDFAVATNQPAEATGHAFVKLEA